jgi:hypothetical protein
MTTDLSKGRELVARSPRRQELVARSPRTARLFERDPDVSPWLFWPTRVVAIVVLVPVMLAWELVLLVKRGVRRYVLEPLGVVLHYVLVVPLRALGRALAWAGRWVRAGLGWLLSRVARVLRLFGKWLTIGLGWLVHYLIAVPARALGRALVWAGRPVVAALAWLGRYAIVLPLRAIGRALRWAGRHALTGLLWVGYYGLVIPARALGRVLRWLGYHTVVVPVRALWRVLRWAGPYARATLAWLGHHLVVMPARAIGWVLRALWELRVPVRRFLYRCLVRPIGWLLRTLVWVPVRSVAVAVHRYGIRPLWTAAAATARSIRNSWRQTTGWFRSAVVSPARDTGRGLLVALGLRR